MTSLFSAVLIAGTMPDMAQAAEIQSTEPTEMQSIETAADSQDIEAAEDLQNTETAADSQDTEASAELPGTETSEELDGVPETGADNIVQVTEAPGTEMEAGLENGTAANEDQYVTEGMNGIQAKNGEQVLEIKTQPEDVNIKEGETARSMHAVS